MNKMQAALAEWRSAWAVPVCGMLGIAGSSIFIFGQGVLLEPVTAELGLTRAQFSSAFFVYSLVALIAFPLGGRLVDRFGPRRVALAAVPLAASSFFIFGLATGPWWQWLLLTVVQTFLVALVSLPVWVSAISSRFDASRGMALAIAISGVGVAIALVPPLAALLLDAFGWRLALGLVAVGWATIMMPLLYFGFYGRVDLERLGKIEREAQVEASASGVASGATTFRQAALGPDFLLIALAGALFASVSVGLVVNLVPILTARGLGLTEAAGLAGIAGIFSIAGRLGTGILLDTLPLRPLALFVFLLPLVVAAMLLGRGTETWLIILTVALLGLAGGSETDIVTYIASRRFETHIFGSLYGLLAALFAVGASIGPLIGSAIFDRTASYDDYFYLAMGLTAASTLSIWIITGRKPAAAEDEFKAA